MLSMVSGSVGFAPNPLDGLTFFFEPARPLAATIVDDAEGLSVEPFGADAVRVRGGAAGLGDVPVAGRLGREAAAEEVRSGGLMRSRAPESRAARWPVVAAARPDRAVACWAAGILLVPDRRRDRRLHARARRSSTCARTCSSAIRRPELDQSKAGGFLDPLLGTFLLTVIGTALAVAARRRDRGLADRVRPAVLAGARGRVRRRGRRRHAEHRARDLRPVVFSQQRPRLPLLHRRGRRRLRPLVLRRRRDDVADRAAAGRRRDARGAAGDPAPRARGVLRARQDEGGDDPPRAAAGRAARHRHRHRARHGPDRRRHRDRRDPARRHAAARRAPAGLGRSTRCAAPARR